MKRESLEKEIEATLNNLRDIKSNKLKAQCLVDTLEQLGISFTSQKYLNVLAIPNSKLKILQER